MRNLRLFGTPIFAAIWVLALVSVAVAGEDGSRSRFRTTLTGYQEVPAISTTATGSLVLEVRSNPDRIDYTLTYSGLQGGTASASHIHFGQKGVNGGVSAFLCNGGDKPACPPTAGTVTGTIDAADIIGPTAQGIDAGEFAEVVRALRAGLVYANVHSTPRWPGGEIRGQINDRSGGDNDRDDEDDDED